MAKKRLEGNKIERVAGKRNEHKVKRRDGRDYTPSKARIALFQTPAGDWRDEEEWPTVEATIVCRTPECPAEGDEIDVRLGENVDGVFRAACGGCGNPIDEMWVDEAVTPLPLEPEKAGGK